MTTAQIEQKKQKIVENFIVLHYRILVQCDNIASKALKLRAYFDISHFFLQEEIECLFVSKNRLKIFDLPETCQNLKEIELLKRGKSIFLFIRH